MSSHNERDKRLYDIIVPVYNGLDFFQDCYESLRKYTSPGHRIVIVDDASTSKAIFKYYDKIKGDPGTLIIKLKKNIGFVGAANRGLSFSSRDVILLNSDTVVTPHWVEKLDAALFSAPNIATATPWTNSGTICSFPAFCQDNPIPRGLTADDLSMIAEAVCPGIYPHIPTAIGFCMAIRRDILEEIGLFDEDTYGRGYGEENDFCMKAWEHGYVHVLDDRTFIEHKGSMSFKDEMPERIQKNLNLVQDRHPLYLPMVESFIKKDPLKEWRNRIVRVIEHRQGNMHILFVIHNDPLGAGNAPVGGSEYHVLTLAKTIREIKGGVPYILSSNGDELLFLEPEGENDWLRRRIHLPNNLDHPVIYDPDYRKRLWEILDIYHIDIISFHHLLHHPIDLSLLLRGWRGGICWTTHDFFPICPSYNLLNSDGEYCGGRGDCSTCSRRLFGYKIDVTGWWRKIFARNLGLMHRIYVPSESAARHITDIYPEITDKILLIEHGIASSNKTGLHSNKRKVLEPPYRIAFLGAMAPPKGSDIVRDIIRIGLKREVEWFVIGDIGDQGLQALSMPNLHKIGKYNQEQLPGLLSKIVPDLIVFCSRWPETYSYTLSESWLAGIPVIVGPLGAPADRVRKTGCGWVAPDITAISILETIQDALKDSSQYIEIKKKIKEIKPPSLKDMTQSYIEDFNKIVSKNPLPGLRKEASRQFWPGHTLDRGREIYDTETIASLKRELFIIQNSIGWRLLERFRRQAWFRTIRAIAQKSKKGGLK